MKIKSPKIQPPRDKNIKSWACILLEFVYFTYIYIF